MLKILEWRLNILFEKILKVMTRTRKDNEYYSVSIPSEWAKNMGINKESQIDAKYDSVNKVMIIKKIEK